MTAEHDSVWGKQCSVISHVSWTVELKLAREATAAQYSENAQTLALAQSVYDDLERRLGADKYARTVRTKLRKLDADASGTLTRGEFKAFIMPVHCRFLGRRGLRRLVERAAPLAPLPSHPRAASRRHGHAHGAFEAVDAPINIRVCWRASRRCHADLWRLAQRSVRAGLAEPGVLGLVPYTCIEPHTR